MSRALDAYKAVWFDAVDTLLASPDAEASIHLFLTEQGYVVDAEQVPEVVRQVMNDRYYHKSTYSTHLCTPESDRAFWVDVYSEIFSGLGLQGEQKLIEQANVLYDLFTGTTMYHLYPDVKETILKLKAMGKQVGIISNFAPTLASIFEALGLDCRMFTPMVISTLVGLEKPDPAIFTYALAESGLEASEVLFVGDHLTNDVVAPNAVSIDAVRIKRSDRQSGEGISTLDALFEQEIPLLSKGR